ncbi:Asp23/Gls24 family envelope stress response protein [Lapidilactobacillus mulanensis]|uniref:Asp23/Gls24 family envelope stress response protein n=1 Tax=Lapidilactobacillus mulanensis TaxID=2485999 RepID=A0ABW4DLM7_9LACO|nr:Asp23/Gls24 family envelope stress response protein [Lapidilactobacillus mulanensis]
MAEEQNILLTQSDTQAGTIQIAPQVLEVILGIAAKQVDGVFEMRGNLTNSIKVLLGRQDHGRGVELSVDGNQINADVYVYLNYGVSVPKVALAMQQLLKEQLYYMTDLELGEVNIHVDGIIPEKAEKIDPSTFFADAISDQQNQKAADQTAGE